VVLTGSLAPDGAIFKRAATTPSLFETEGRAVVFEDLADLSARIEYRYTDLGDTDFTVSGIGLDGAQVNFENTFHAVRAGLSWHFN